MFPCQLNQIAHQPRHLDFSRRTIEVLVHKLRHVRLKRRPLRFHLAPCQLQQRRARAPLIAPHKPPNEIHKRSPCAGVQIAHHAKIQKAHALIRHDLYIAGVRVGVEKAVREYLLHHQIRDGPAQLARVQSRRLDFLDPRRLDAVDIFHHQNARRREVAEQGGKINRWLLPELPGEPFQIPGFTCEIQLPLQRPRQFVHQRHRTPQAPLRLVRLRQHCQAAQNGQVIANRVLNARTLHLDNHILPRH